MRTIVLSAWLLAAVIASAQVEIHGGATAQGGGTASFLNGATPPSDTIGSDGDFYLNTSAYCLYGPKAAGAWPTTCVSLIGPTGPQGPPGTSGNLSFSGVSAGTNSNALLVAGTLDPTAGGAINANKLGGVLLSGLSSGLLKNTAGAPGIAGSSDITAALTFTPENAGRKGVASGYASLDAGAKVPAAQIPAITAVNG